MQFAWRVSGGVGTGKAVSLTPAGLLALLIAGRLLAWTLAPALTRTAPPIDVLESYLWGREWVIATYKHPALPAWFLEMSWLLTGAYGWPAYLVSQLFIAVALTCAYLLGRDMMDPERAAAGVLLLAGVTFYLWPGCEFNHDIAALPFWAGLPLALWRAVERRALVWWIVVGLLAAGGLYAKLSTGLLLIVAAGWVLFDGRARRSLSTAGPWIALTVAIVLFAPLAAWLVANEFAPIKQAANERVIYSGSLHGLLSLGGVAVSLAGLFVILAVAGLIGPARSRSPTSPTIAAPQERALLFLSIVTIGPFALALITLTLLGASLRPAWCSSMFGFAGVLAIALTTRRFSAAAFRWIAFCAALATVIVPLGYANAILMNSSLTKTPMRANWPQDEIASRMAMVWARETGRPLRIIAGDGWLAGLVGLRHPDRPSILTHGDMKLSPWVTPARLKKDGALVMWRVDEKNPSKTIRALATQNKVGEQHFYFPRFAAARPLVLGYAIVPPGSVGSPTLDGSDEPDKIAGDF